MNADLILSFPTIVCLAWLSALEHRRSVRPPDLVVLYLLSTSLLDAVCLALPSYLDMPFGLTLGLAAKVVLLLLECQRKDSILPDARKQRSGEENASLFSKAFFWWIHPILALGYRNILLNHDLPPIKRSLKSSTLRSNIMDTWHRRGVHIPSRLLHDP